MADWRQWLDIPQTLLTHTDPWGALVLFLAATSLMIWRLSALEQRGLEGTVLGTLVMPYGSGFSNLIFAWVMGKTGGAGQLVLENCLVNNVTNLTLLVGLPAIIWPMIVMPRLGHQERSRPRHRAKRLSKLSLLLTLVAAVFFTGILWALAQDRTLDRSDGMVLVAIFLFWQVFHVFDILKQRIQKSKPWSWMIALDWVLVIVGGWGVYVGIDQIVAWIPKTGSGLFVFDNLGWLSGLIMVVPNALLAFYYARLARPDIVYSSQVGDGHICIPMCIGLFALFQPMAIPDQLPLSVLLLVGAGALHFLFLSVWGGLPRWMGVVLTGAYGYFLYAGIIQ